MFEANVAVAVDGEDVPDVEIETDGLDATVVDVIDFPPVAPVQGTETVVLFVLVTVPIVGVCGTVVAVMLEEAELASDVPTAFVAVTVKV